MGLDMNVQEAWAEGVTGKGTVVTILDDGLEKDHPDIRRNYVRYSVFLFFGNVELTEQYNNFVSFI